MERILGAIESAKEKAAELNEEYRISSSIAERVSATANNVAITVLDSTTATKEAMVQRATTAKDAAVERVTFARETIADGVASTKDAFNHGRANASRKEPTFEVVSWTRSSGSSKDATKGSDNCTESATDTQKEDVEEIAPHECDVLRRSDISGAPVLPPVEAPALSPVEAPALPPVEAPVLPPLEEVENALLALAACVSDSARAAAESIVVPSVTDAVFFTDEENSVDVYSLADPPCLSSRTTALIVTAVSLLPTIYGTVTRRSLPFHVVACSLGGVGLAFSQAVPWTKLMEQWRVLAKTMYSKFPRCPESTHDAHSAEGA